LRYADCLLTAFASLRSNLLRSVLTALGIIIGVAAVIAMVAVGSGADHRVQSVIQNLGANLLLVLNGSTTSSGRRGGYGSKPSLTEGDARAIKTEIDIVEISASTVRGSGQAVFGNLNWYTTFRGTDVSYFDAREWVVERGRLFNGAEIRSAAKVALLGQTVAGNLFADTDPVGQTIRINRVPFRVIGTFVAKGQTPSGNDQDDTIFMPLSTVKKRVLGGRQTTPV